MTAKNAPNDPGPEKSPAPAGADDRVLLEGAHSRLLEFQLIFRAMREAGLVDLEIERFGFFPPQIYNRPFGRKLDHAIGSLGLLNPVLPFQMFKGSAPR